MKARLGERWQQLRQQRWSGYAVSLFMLTLTATVLSPFYYGLDSVTVALCFLVVVLLTATWFGSGPALLSSVGGMVYLHRFYTPTFDIGVTEPDEWIAVATFLLTAVLVGELSARTRRRTDEAEARRKQVEDLYRELQQAFERASHAEALRQSEQLKTALLDAVTHDLRTPLTSIKASATMLLRASHKDLAGYLDEDGRLELLEIINEESDRLNRFIEGVVELARIEAGDLALQQSALPVADIVRTALDRAGNLLREHSLQVSVSPALPQIRVDARLTAQVIYTLLENASKYAPRGSVITIRAELNSPAELTITVSDQGTGIPAEFRDRVFEKFFRVTQGQGRPRGQGLGLAIARGIVEAHGGKIWVDDAPGGGAAIRFTLPVAAEPAQAAAASRAQNALE